MHDALIVAGSVFIPLAFGLVPAFLPATVPALFRWTLWLAVLALTGWYVHLMRETPNPYPFLALVILLVSAGLSMVVLVVETGRYARPRRRA